MLWCPACRTNGLGVTEDTGATFDTHSAQNDWCATDGCQPQIIENRTGCAVEREEKYLSGKGFAGWSKVRGGGLGMLVS